MKTPKKPLTPRCRPSARPRLEAPPANAAEAAAKRLNPAGLLTPRGYTHVGLPLPWAARSMSRADLREREGRSWARATSRPRPPRSSRTRESGARRRRGFAQGRVKITFRGEPRDGSISRPSGAFAMFFAGLELPASTLGGHAAPASPD